MHLIADLESQARPSVEHREHDALDREAWIQALADEPDGFEEMGESLKRVELALQGHEDPVGGRECVDRQQAKRRGTVDDHEVVGLGHGLECDSQAILALVNGHQLEYRLRVDRKSTRLNSS